jgi:hypothetical protein
MYTKSRDRVEYVYLYIRISIKSNQNYKNKNNVLNNAFIFYRLIMFMLQFKYF